MKDHKPGKFDVAISTLNDCEHGYLPGQFPAGALTAAIAFLQAGAKVDKDELDWALGYLEGTYAKSIRALLDTLPDGHPQSGEPKEKR